MAGTRASNPWLLGPLQTPTRKRRNPGDPPEEEQFQTPNRPGPSGGGGPGGNGDDPDDPDDDDGNGGNAGNGGNPGNDRNDREDLIDAITSLTHAMQPKSRAKPKVKEPDTFDGSNPRKLSTFLLQCELYFRNYDDYDEDDKRINFALTYLRGSALDWFEPTLLNPDGDEDAYWLYDWSAFVSELEENFGTIDPKAEAASELDNLKMKENGKILQYNVSFNTLASKL